ncbi:DUF5522 domain-containing protein [Halobacteriovorax sp. HLS]|uniref:DUF5522 domain-containing protein n=1 Tax=Halobacteriovorax sp. HLS TaxID=2234000 RepID=UPI000FD80B37|nr:DUF5522 domain-containing protein [Halobacteriovorax sp. HLS]
MSELTYLNEEGLDVYTSTYLSNRGSCCKTNCLHCPYGFTLKNHPLELIEVTDEMISVAQSIIDKNTEVKKESVSESLLSSAFGTKKKVFPITSSNRDRYKLIKLKGQLCGVLKMGTLVGIEIYLNEHFKNQGLSLEIVNSFVKIS